MMTWLLTCRADRLARLKRKRAARNVSRKLAARQAEAHARLGSRTLIPAAGRSWFLYRP